MKGCLKEIWEASLSLVGPLGTEDDLFEKLNRSMLLIPQLFFIAPKHWY